MGPLCDKCGTKDCSNAIVLKEVSVFGINKKYKLCTRGEELFVVVDCEGFIPE